MKAYTHIFREGLTKGLRRYATHPRNVQSLVECHNAVPREEGLESYANLDVVSVSGGGGDWTGSGVWPQVYFLERYVVGFAMVGSDLGWFELTHTSGLTFTASLVKTVSVPTQIGLANSGTFYIITFYNGSSANSCVRYPDGSVEVWG